MNSVREELQKLAGAKPAVAVLTAHALVETRLDEQGGLPQKSPKLAEVLTAIDRVAREAQRHPRAITEDSARDYVDLCFRLVGWLEQRGAIAA